MKPYVKYGKLYLIFSALFAAIILPLDSILQVYFPQAALNLLSSHKGFSVIVFTAIGFECALLLITLLDEDSTETDIAEAKKILGLDSIVEKNDASRDSTLTREFDDNGIELSGGEAQKIAIARTTTKKFSLLMLDEPSSALDPIAEYNLNRSLLTLSKGTTTIMIAHRLSSVRNMDKILVINGGKLVESGTHDELMSAQGLYAEMFLKQAENYQI